MVQPILTTMLRKSFFFAMLLSQSVLEVRLTSNGSFEVICGSSNGLEFVTRVIYRQEQQLELVVENGIVV